MTPLQREAWFVYHAPTAETKPKYEQIRACETTVYNRVLDAEYYMSSPDLHSAINEECLRFADLVMALAPDCEDRATAIEHIRMARHAFNEWAVVVRRDPSKPRDNKFLEMGKDELVKARWKSNSAIACGGV